MAQSMFSMKVTGLRLDTPKIKRAVDRAKRQALIDGAKEIRIDAKRAMEASARGGRLKESDLSPKLRAKRKTINAIRKRQGKGRLSPLHKPSKPGHAPAAGRSSPLNSKLAWSYDKETGSVVVGPKRFKAGKAPALLEFGGKTTITSKRSGKKRVVKIAPRPFMAPALREEVEKGTLPKMWRNSIRGG